MIGRIFKLILASFILAGSLGGVPQNVRAEEPSKTAAAQTRTLLFPGMGTWYVCQGYNTNISHLANSNLRYSLDLTTDPNSVATGVSGCNGKASAVSGVKIYAPAAGKIIYLSSRTDLINFQLDSGGCLQIGHLATRAAANVSINQGAELGTLSAPNANNGQYSHIHLTAFSDTACSKIVAFEENSNFRFYGAPDMPATTTAYAYRKTVITRFTPSSGCSVPSGQFCGEYYNNRSLSGSPTFTQNTGSINFNWNSGGPGNGVGNDNFSVRWQGTYPFESATYTFTINGDDGIRLYVDGGLQIDGWRDQSATTYTKDVNLSAGNHTIKVEYYENGGGAVAQASWSKKIVNLARGKTTWATSSQSSSYLPGMAVDGNLSSRWSSAQSPVLGTQWLTVDLGSAQSINQIVVRWEAAFAKEYFVGYSMGPDCKATTYSGWNFYPITRQDQTINFSTVTARCVGILMRQRATGMWNYSIFEVEVYKK